LYIRRLKPDTRFYAFIDGRNIGRWVAQDTRFTGIPDNSVGVFGANEDGSAIITDSNGDASGILYIPSRVCASTRSILEWKYQ